MIYNLPIIAEYEYYSAVEFYEMFENAYKLFEKAFPEYAKKITEKYIHSDVIYDMFDDGWTDEEIINECLDYTEELYTIEYVDIQKQTYFRIAKIDKDMMLSQLKDLFDKKYFSRKYFNELIAKEV